ncbi:nuclease [Natronolimnobius sp. AArcel1]|nr:nuclease [Natronolimnobius sp. AArcel1]
MALTGTALGTTFMGVGRRSAVPTSVDEIGIDALSFYSAASQIAADGESELADDETAVVWAEPTAYNFESTDDGPETVVYDDNPIPLVSEDGPVVGLGTVDFVSDDQGGFDVDNEAFLVNLFDAKIGGEGTVLWDEGHDQFHELGLEYYHSFDQYAADAGYDLTATTNILGGTELLFPSTASQVAAGGGPLTDPSHVVVWAESTAQNVDDAGDEASYIYGDGEDIPLVSRDGTVVGIGTPELLEDGDFTDANEQFVLNVLADTIGDAGTILWDDAHETYYDPSTFGEFEAAVESEGYEFEASEDLLGGDTAGISELEFFSTASLLDADGDLLTDESLVAVWAESTAENVDEYGDGHVSYDGVDADIPLVAVDDGVVGVGTDLATDESDVDATREFLVNAWEDRIGSTGTVRYDESHGQALTLDDYSDLAATAADRGFDVAATDDLAANLDDADLVMITTPQESFTEDTLNALTAFVADGGVVFAHDEADYGGHSTDALNDLIGALEAGFRFNSDQVIDEENSGWAPFVVRTTNFNEAFDFFSEGGDDESAVDAADAVIIPSPADAYTDTEFEALADHVAGGGAVFLLDESEFTNEETSNLNAIAGELDLAFRFNADQVEDETHNDGVEFVPTTSNFNEGFDVFHGLDGAGLEDAEGLVITSPTAAFTDTELEALENFVADGGAVFLFDESDFGGQGNTNFGFDETENLNAIADALDLSFRFNSDQVNDGDGEFDITTTNFNTAFDYFAERENSIGIDFNSDEEYYGRVVRVFDGDTFEVEFDSEYDYRDVVRHLGFDTAETGDAENEIHEWFGIEDLEHLDEWGTKATEFALDRMTPEGTGAGDTDVEGRRIKLTFDDVEPIRGNYGRLLGYMHYDPDDFDADPETGAYSVDYNLEMVEEGYARVYSSGFSRHDEFAAVEEDALADGRGVWSASDFDTVPEHRNDPVEDVFVPHASSVTTDSGPLADERVPVVAGPTAEQEPLGDDENEFDTYDDDAPLIGIDRDNRVAMVGGLLFNEAYEDLEGFPADTSEYGNFPLLTNLARYLSTNDGDFLIEGGHAQFDVSGSLSLERTQYYLRYLEGVGLRLRQFNDVVNTLPEEDDPTVVFLTAPGRAYTDAELETLREYRDAGGAVILIGSTDANSAHRGNLDAVAAGLGSDLRLNDDRVVDAEANLADDPAIPVTSGFDSSFPLFSPVGDGQFDHLEPEQRAYLELVADESGTVSREAVDGAIGDWSAGRIERETLDATIQAWSQDLQVIAP